MNKNINARTVLIVVTTLALGITAVTGAWMLYQTRQQAIAPNAPQKVPAAGVTTQCTPLSFNLAAAPTATATATATAAPTTTATPTSAPISTKTATPTSAATAKAIAKGGTTSPSPALPVAGVSWPGIMAGAGGVILLILGAILAF